MLALPGSAMAAGPCGTGGVFSSTPTTGTCTYTTAALDTFTVPERERTDPTYRDQLRRHNEYNLRIFDLIQADALEGKGVVISLTDCYRETDYGEPIAALKSYIMSPFSEEQYVDSVLESIWKAREVLKGQK